ncbi:MAG: hypothetical protein U0U69_13690 [Acidimicrobiia bacterium]
MVLRARDCGGHEGPGWLSPGTPEPPGPPAGRPGPAAMSATVLPCTTTESPGAMSATVPELIFTTRVESFTETLTVPPDAVVT